MCSFIQWYFDKLGHRGFCRSFRQARLVPFADAAISERLGHSPIAVTHAGVYADGNRSASQPVRKSQRNKYFETVQTK